MILRHGPYIAKVDYFDGDSALHGTVVNIRDTVHFAGRSLDELKAAFADSVADYQAFCAEQGVAPDKPYAGRYPLRFTSPELHRRADLAASLKGLSLNAYINQLVERDTADLAAEETDPTPVD